MLKAKEWKAGNANENWKVNVCKYERDQAEASISFIEYILGSSVENFTGAEIKQAVRDYISSGKKSIERGGLKNEITK